MLASGRGNSELFEMAGVLVNEGTVNRLDGV